MGYTRAQRWASLQKKARRGFRGYPIGTIALYGPDDRRASKIVAAIVAGEGRPPDPLQRWHAETGDVRWDAAIGEEVAAFFREHGARTIVAADRIIGCPHEEGIDYPEGTTCPRCPFWANRDRWTGEPNK